MLVFRKVEHCYDSSGYTSAFALSVRNSWREDRVRNNDSVSTVLLEGCSFRQGFLNEIWFFTVRVRMVQSSPSAYRCIGDKRYPEGQLCTSMNVLPWRPALSASTLLVLSAASPCKTRTSPRRFSTVALRSSKRSCSSVVVFWLSSIWSRSVVNFRTRCSSIAATDFWAESSSRSATSSCEGGGALGSRIFWFVVCRFRDVSVINRPQPGDELQTNRCAIFVGGRAGGGPRQVETVVTETAVVGPGGGAKGQRRDRSRQSGRGSPRVVRCCFSGEVETNLSAVRESFSQALVLDARTNSGTRRRSDPLSPVFFSKTQSLKISRRVNMRSRSAKVFYLAFCVCDPLQKMEWKKLFRPAARVVTRRGSPGCTLPASEVPSWSLNNGLAPEKWGDRFFP